MVERRSAVAPTVIQGEHIPGFDIAKVSKFVFEDDPQEFFLSLNMLQPISYGQDNLGRY